MSKIIEIPERLEDIPLSSYQSYMKGLKEGMSEDDLAYHTVSTLCSGDVEAIGALSIRELILITAEIQRIINAETNVIYRFKIEETDYALIPDLKNISAREWTNIMQFLDNGKFENMHHVLAILYRPIVREQFGRYELTSDIYSEDRARLFQSIGMHIVQGVMLFFSKIIDSYSTHSKDYLQMKEMKANGNLNVLGGIT